MALSARPWDTACLRQTLSSQRVAVLPTDAERRLELRVDRRRASAVCQARG